MRHNKVRHEVCSLCSKGYETQSSRSKYCSGRCADKGRKLLRAYNIPSRMGELSNAAKHRARSKGIPYNISPEYVLYLWEKQSGRCALTETVLDLTLGEAENVANKDGPSLDRIAPEFGYVMGNVRLVTFQVNCAKGSYSDIDLIQMCRAIVGRAF